MNAVVFGLFLAAIVASTAAESGSISVLNSGGYVARYTVDYKVDGVSKTEDSTNFSLGVTKAVKIPEGATDVYLKVEEYWFPGQLTTIFTKTYDSPVNKCFKIWGTTLNPSYSEETC